MNVHHRFLIIALGITLATIMFSPSSATALRPCDTRCKPATRCNILCEGPTETLTCAEWGVCDSNTTYDMLNWMRQTYSDSGTTHLAQRNGNGVISEFSSCNFSNGFYRVSSKCGQNHEKFVFDGNNIFLVRESFQDSSSHFKTHDNFVWLRRVMRSGDSFVADCSWIEFDGCDNPDPKSCSDTTTLTGPVSLELGGEIGTVAALIRSQTLGDGTVEQYFYAKPYGFVKYRHLTSNGSLIRKEVFKLKISGEVQPHMSPCFPLQCGANMEPCN